MDEKERIRKNLIATGELLSGLVALDNEFDQDVCSALDITGLPRDMATMWKKFDAAHK